MSNSRGNRSWYSTGARSFQGNRGRNTRSRPPGLKGKEIGLYYKNLYKKNKKTDTVINLTIPSAIISAINKNLMFIETVAKTENIELSFTNIFESLIKPKTDLIKRKESPHPEEYDVADKRYKEGTNISLKNDLVPNFETDTYLNENEKILLNIKDETHIEVRDEPSSLSTLNDIPIKTEPSSVSMPDYIPFKNENIMNDCVNSERILGLRERHYKYGYQDIITGTFDEKLTELLTQGIQITSNNNGVRKLNHDYYKEYNEMVGKLSYNKMLEFRETLPAYKKKEDILDNIDKSQVLVISGETGCGKSTQIPQLILDRAMNNNTGANVRILVTQPRRIAASSLAMRVANERAEMLGNSVGYSVRLEKVESRTRGSIMFCTTGVLLTELEVDQALTKFSHIILDEVHERDTHVDLAMAMLKQILKKRKDLKLILMSATLDAEVLSAYFDDCPVVCIEGLAYPVTDVYLEDILKLTNYQIQKEKVKKNEKQKWKKYERKGKSEANEMQKDIQYKAEIGPWLESIKNNIPRDVYKTLQDPEIEEFNVDLIVELLKYICKGEPGAILVFLPGIGEITKVMRCMELHGFLNEKHEIYPLHSKLATLEQRKIFMRPPLGVRKIILATNIAETSITIDDIVYVVDSGRIKVSGLNVEENISTLKTEWVSKANLHQRRGRAGRCQPGICYYLLTSYRAGTLADRLLPELQRSNLLEPVLMVKKLRLGLANTAFQMVPSPPAEKTVEWAVRHLQKCGALYKTETLTPLGWHLARLPVHPAAGKLLLLGALFGCLDRAASVAAVWSFKDPFLLVIGKESEIKDVKRRLAMGEPSDHVAMSEAIMQWESCSYRDRRSFAYDNFLSNNTLELLVDMKKQLGENLTQMGFLSSSNLQAQWENRNWNNISLFKAIVAASLYPNVARVRWCNLKSYKKPKSILAYCPEDGKVKVHPSSVMAFSHGMNKREEICTNSGANWLVYWLKQKSSDLFLIDVNLVYTLPLLFFGEYSVKEDLENPDDCLMSITKNINVRCNKNSANTILKLRILLDQVLANKVMETCPHSVKQSQFEDEVLKTVIELITAEDEQADYIDDDVSVASDDNWH
ncbi:ATP-dependent DNA/RNA helicase DHX36-like isoform X1 [Pieris napi]|uniref:ATP-dependent DNA/RNA helicase DHX36-like isoform X1 n=1 Tax=Pieris napi TaxID=78633 RepID=UPI001FB934AA|nr:ATP-dependent DNA/RNA helicase DHX36-like isoform X1 [Pieris napi]